MMNKEKKDLEEEKRERGCPISVDCWTALLSDKILNVEMELFLLTNLCIIILLACMGGIVAGLYEDSVFSVLASYVFLVFAVIVGLMFVSWRNRIQARLEPLRDIREKIITGELNTPDKIRERCLIKRLCLDV